MNHLNNFNEFEQTNEKFNVKTLLLAGFIFLASCVNVKIENKNEEKIENIEYSNEEVHGNIIDKTFIGGKPSYYKCIVVDKNGNSFKLNMGAYLFGGDKKPQIGDDVKLVFDEDGKSCEVYKNSKKHPEDFKQIYGGGKGFWK